MRHAAVVSSRSGKRKARKNTATGRLPKEPSRTTGQFDIRLKKSAWPTKRLTWSMPLLSWQAVIEFAEEANAIEDLVEKNHLRLASAFGAALRSRISD
ncbi:MULTISPECIES: hypothetical protein [Sinorhizobium]|uniref:Uncharacterized protein n=1 Tax=Sinorhizobium americanum TaxID=194963 RepID=A0A2S3YRX6_9HYPH|nr:MULTISPECIES: hypothetical protein [Sinorhizobium]ASY60042.1 hypothetical protein SS05631_b59500 [Sinorhizobium sp. CCBAU 05631]PDT43380.1 hypothetical protein CO656_01430 [Sinorhizobium sp. FG01]POH34381.1 hypothetical protein ATY31_07960 [Sinorhizobium americanum]